MKVPKDFIPEKDLENKTKEFLKELEIDEDCEGLVLDILWGGKDYTVKYSIGDFCSIRISREFVDRTLRVRKNSLDEVSQALKKICDYHGFNNSIYTFMTENKVESFVEFNKLITKKDLINQIKAFYPKVCKTVEVKDSY